MNTRAESVAMTLTKKLAAPLAAGLTLAAIAVAAPASAADGVLPPNRICPTFLSEWTFYAGVYSEQARNLSIYFEVGRQCGYLAETDTISANGASTEVRYNAQVTITKGFVYPIVIL